MSKFVLVVSSPQPNPNPGNGAGELAVRHSDGRERCMEMVLPGRIFTGREGRFRIGTGQEERTGWYEPVGVMPTEEAARLVGESLWDSHWHGPVPAAGAPERQHEGGGIVAPYAVTGPWEFPGLAEHYPEFATPEAWGFRDAEEMSLAHASQDDEVAAAALADWRTERGLPI